MLARFHIAAALLDRLLARPAPPSGRMWWAHARAALVAVHDDQYLRKLAHRETFKGGWTEIRDHGPSADAQVWGAQAHTALYAFWLRTQGIEPAYASVLIELFGRRKEPSPAELDALYVRPMLSWLKDLVEDEMTRSTTRIEFDTTMLTPDWESTVRREALELAPTLADVECSRHPLGGLRIRLDLAERQWTKDDAEQLSFRVRQRLTEAWRAANPPASSPIVVSGNTFNQSAVAFAGGTAQVVNQLSPEHSAALDRSLELVRASDLHAEDKEDAERAISRMRSTSRPDAWVRAYELLLKTADVALKADPDLLHRLSSWARTLGAMLG
jgi:hypothetical protein